MFQEKCTSGFEVICPSGKDAVCTVVDSVGKVRFRGVWEKCHSWLKSRQIKLIGSTESCTLLDFWNEHEIRNVWVSTSGLPGGTTWRHNIDTDGEDYCDINEFISEHPDLFRLTGFVVDETWCWDGGEDVMFLKNSLLNLKVW